MNATPDPTAEPDIPVASSASVASSVGPDTPPRVAGWYPNPSGEGERWWDGNAWTIQTRLELAPEGGPHPYANGRREYSPPGQALPVGSLVPTLGAIVSGLAKTGLFAKVNLAPVATILTAVIVAVVAIGGLVITVTHPETLSFHTYVDQLVGLAFASGILGIGRGMAAAK